MSVIYSYLTTSEIILKVRMLSRRDFRIVTNSKIVSEGKVFKLDVNKFGQAHKKLAFAQKYVEGIEIYQSKRALL